MSSTIERDTGPSIVGPLSRLLSKKCSYVVVPGGMSKSPAAAVVGQPAGHRTTSSHGIVASGSRHGAWKNNPFVIALPVHREAQWARKDT